MKDIAYCPPPTVRPQSVPFCPRSYNLSITGSSCHKYHFCHDTSFLSWQKWYLWQLPPVILVSHCVFTVIVQNACRQMFWCTTNTACRTGPRRWQGFWRAWESLCCFASLTSTPSAGWRLQSYLVSFCLSYKSDLITCWGQDCVGVATDRSAGCGWW